MLRTAGQTPASQIVRPIDLPTCPPLASPLCAPTHPLLQKWVFYAAMSPLVAFYVLFTLVLYPMHGSLHLNGFVAATAPLVPHGLHGLLKGGWVGGAAAAAAGCVCVLGG